MSLKFKLDSLDGLDEATKALYKQVGSKFVLDVETDDANSDIALKLRRESLLAEIKQMKTQLNTAGDKRADDVIAPPEVPDTKLTPQEKHFAASVHRLAGLTGAARDAEIAKIVDGSPEVIAKLGDHRRATESRVAKLKSNVSRLEVERVARQIVADIARPGSESILLPHVTQRLTAVADGDDYRVAVVGRDGKPSTLTPDALIDEFKSNAAFGPVLRDFAGEAAAHARRVALAMGEKSEPPRAA